MTERVPAIKLLLLPKDTNAYGTIFGGVILSNIDLASAVEARKVAPHRYVTKAMREVEFHEPVFVGDIVSFLHRNRSRGAHFGHGSGIGRGRTVGHVRLGRAAGRSRSEACSRCTEAEVILVAVNSQGRPVPVRLRVGRVSAHVVSLE